MERMKSIRICRRPKRASEYFQMLQHRQDICHVFPSGFRYQNPSHTIAVFSGLSVCLSVCPVEIKEWSQSLRRIVRNKCSHHVWLQHLKCKKERVIVLTRNDTHAYTRTAHIHIHSHICAHNHFFFLKVCNPASKSCFFLLFFIQIKHKKINIFKHVCNIYRFIYNI